MNSHFELRIGSRNQLVQLARNVERTPETPRASWAVWVRALGYFLCYAVYSGLIKHFTQSGKDTSGLLLLPSITLGTALTLPLVVIALGWGRRALRFDRYIVASGVVTGII